MDSLIENRQRVFIVNTLTVSNWQTEIRPTTTLPYVGLEETRNLVHYGYTGQPNAIFHVDNAAPNTVATIYEPRTVRLVNFYNRNYHLPATLLGPDMEFHEEVFNSDLLFIGDYMHRFRSNATAVRRLVLRGVGLSFAFERMPTYELDLNINTLANIANHIRGTVIEFPYLRIVDIATLEFLIFRCRVRGSGLTQDYRRQDILDLIHRYRNG